MTISDLEKKLKAAHIRTDCYSITGEVKNEALILEKRCESQWLIYYSERGLKTGERFFDKEEDACACFFEMAIRDPLMRKAD